MITFHKVEEKERITNKEIQRHQDSIVRLEKVRHSYWRKSIRRLLM
jgi:hypothetical protein